MFSDLSLETCEDLFGAIGNISEVFTILLDTNYTPKRGSQKLQV